MGSFERAADGLANVREEILKPWGLRVERFAAFDAGKFDGTKGVRLIFVVTDDAAFAPQGTIDGEMGTLLDEREVAIIGRGCPGEVTTFLHEHFFGTEHFGELLAKPLTGIDRIEFYVTEGIARNGFSAGLHFGYDTRDTSAFADENIHVVVGVHQGPQPGGFASEVQFHLWDVNAMNGEVGAGEAEAR